MSIQNAEQKAQLVAKHAWDGKFPVCPEKIVRALNALSEARSEKPLVTLRGVSANALNGASGMAEWCSDGEAKYRCFYNHDEAPVRQRFTQAHELGHVMLKHVDEHTVQMRDDRFDNSNPIETEANAFAAELLMPRRWLPQLLSEADTIESLAATLGVSITALHYRLRNLRLL